MSNFTPLVEREYDFDGDHIKVTFARLTRKDMLASMPAFLKLDKAEEGSDDYNAAINDVLNNISDSMPNYIRSFEGLTNAEGEQITIDTVVNEMYFMVLCAQIATDMMKESSVTGGNV